MKKQKTIIHFMRHGQVENPSGVRYGRLPGFHLSAEGRRNVAGRIDFFAQRKINHIYASPLERTQQTATILGIALHDIPISLDRRLLEVKPLKKFEGKTRDASFYIPNQPTEDAEGKDQVITRLEHFVESKIVEHHGGEIVAISHGDPIALLYHALVFESKDLEYHRYPKFVEIYSFVFDGASLASVWIHDSF